MHNVYVIIIYVKRKKSKTNSREKESEMANTITLKMKFEATAAILKGEKPEIEWTIDEAIAFLNDRAEKATSKKTAYKPSAESLANQAKITEFLTDNAGNAFVAKAIAEAIDITPAKANGALRVLVKNGTVEAEPGEKKGSPLNYRIA